jgi:hypothetical protein
MSVSDAWTSTTPGSTARKNRTSVITDTGSVLDGLDKTKHKIVTCSSTGSGYTLDHAYLFTEDGTSAIDLSTTGAHTHADSSEGGALIDIIIANPKIFDLSLTKTNDLKKAQWIETVTSTGTIEDNTDGTTGERSIRLRPNGTSGASAQISYPHLKLDFSAGSMYQAKLQIETATSIALHSGVGADDVTAADSNTRKYQAEVCTVTNNNWWLRTASGSANSASDSGIAISTSRVAISIVHYPTLGTPRADLQVDAGTLLQKTTNIPVDQATADINLIKHSVKNSTAADRPLKVYGSRLQYKVSDNWV